jgi:hypothetical protein
LLEDQPHRISDVSISAEAYRFSHAAESDPWRRGLLGAGIATVVASPWIFLSVRHDVLTILLRPYPFSLGQFLVIVPFELAWWAGLGFFFGWAYPVIRGSNGTFKALVMLAAIGLPLLLLDIFPGPPARHTVVNSVQTVAEAASVLLVLGLAADYLLLKRAGFGFSKLVEARRLSAIAAWATSLATAVGVAVTSIIVGGVTGALTYLSHPNSQAPPPDTGTSKVGP